MSEEKEAEFVRIPFANNSLYPIRAGVDEEAFIMLNEILSTRFTCVVLNTRVNPGYMLASVEGQSGWTFPLTTPFQGRHEIFGNTKPEHLGNSVGFYRLVICFYGSLSPKLARLVSGLASGTGMFLETWTQIPVCLKHSRTVG